MFIELGHFCLILSVLTSLMSSVFAFYEGGKEQWFNKFSKKLSKEVLPKASKGLSPMVSLLAWLTLGLVLIAFASLLYAFVTDDFSVRYVATNSNSQLPMFYKIAALWAGHEGSLLLWLLFSYVWLGCVLLGIRHLDYQIQNYTVAIMLLVSLGFSLFILLTSNPFVRQIPVPVDGADLNPLLQHSGLAIHPPALYLGYVGFSVVFALALAALLSNKLDISWARAARSWALAAWTFLTVGITIGSMWAYGELGWGGWWFWDPVENASLMPWLLGTALLHVLMVSQKRGLFKGWTVFLAISTFSLSLIGMFLVRSGVLISVHAFASNPSRGVAMLLYLTFVLGLSILLYSWRSQDLKQKGYFSLVSREGLLLLNNILLIVACATVLFGTLFPLFSDVLGIGKFSVGAPYFNHILLPIWLILFGLLFVLPQVAWRETILKKYFKTWMLEAIFALLVAIGMMWKLSKQWQWIPFVVFFLAWTVVFSHLYDVYQHRFKQSRRRWAMTLAHIGLAVFAMGATGASFYDQHIDRVIKPKEHVQIGEFGLQFSNIEGVTGKNYQALIGYFRLDKKDKPIALLKPEKRQYLSGGDPMTEAAIYHGFWQDFYVSMGEMQGVDPAVSAWLIRIYIKPLMNWLWFGCFLMVFSGILVLTKRNKQGST